MRLSVLPLALLPIIAVLSFSANAEPVMLPSGAIGIKGTVYEERASWARARVGLGIQGNVIDNSELRDQNGEVEGDIGTVKIIYSVADRVDLYADFGVASGMEYSAEQTVKNVTRDVTFAMSDETVLGVGIAVVLYQEDNGLSLNADLKYRKIQDMDYDSVTVDETTYSRNQLTDTSGAVYEQWHAALGLSYQFGMLTPYAGIKFVGGDYSAMATETVTSSHTTYELRPTGNDSRVGAYAGLTLLPAERLAIDIQGRVIDEEAFSASLTFMF
ncbi:hypothetical protein [Thiohalophilus thiocyanatoxydans]|uniref:Major outer membrane protein n=1 Tax=Thiohalophilus thiocyanatoxydans TaxID=381308 RepID=A0A4R8IK54_9GAMM|nr:hypothetical protein [Thiohalophilus thiocyanatoxydans]TDY01122.1 major outer membrane protein [Thiohalophilus thiocyanatoxydans]